MRSPNGIHAESDRTPKASRAGALYLYSTLLNSTSRGSLESCPFQDQVPTSLVRARDWNWR